MRLRQKGVSMLFVAVVLLLIAAVALAFLALTRTRTGVDRSAETTAHLAKVQSALEQFASAAERLPCPANPAIDTGDEEPIGPSTNCAFPAGTVPWRTIGLRREDSLDAWGWKISYRVYQGPIGMTQAGGASMVHCNTAPPAPAVGREPTTGLCRNTHNTSEAEFLAGKGLSVSDFGAAAVTDVAYVLISHGPSGLGAYTTSGGLKQPNPAGADELANLGWTGPFVAKAAVTDVSPENAAYFDDVLAYRRLADFVKRANLSARNWLAPGLANVTFDAPTVNAAAGNTNTDLGRTSLRFTGVTVSVSAAGAPQDVSFTTSGAYGGLGGVGGGPGISSTNSELLRMDFDLKARQLAVTLNRFGTLTGNSHPERAQLTFFDDDVQVGSSVLSACKHDADNEDPATNTPPTGAFGLATFSVPVPANFNRVEIQGLVASGGGSLASIFYVSQVRTCDAVTSPCSTSFSNTDNLCP